MQTYPVERLYTVEEFLAMEDGSEIKHEYMDGWMLAFSLFRPFDGVLNELLQ